MSNTRKQRRSNKGQKAQQTISSAEAKLVIDGINRVFEFTDKTGDNAKLSKAGSVADLTMVIFSYAQDFKRADFGKSETECFNAEEKAVLDKLGINTYKPREVKAKADSYTRATALSDAFKGLSDPATKDSICKTSDQLFRDKNPETKAVTYEAANAAKKPAVAEQFFRYAVPFAVALGVVETTGKGAETHYSLTK